MGRRLLIIALFFLCFLLLSTHACAEEKSLTIDADEAAADAAAEEAAAAAVGDAAEAEEDDDADALDEDADAARLDLQNPDKHPLSNLPPSARDVEIGFVFSEQTADKTLVLGQAHRTLIGFANSGKLGYHIWGVMGSLNMPHNFQNYVQNFSYGQVNRTVFAGEELSFDYVFTPHERLDTRDFGLALTVFYEARGSTGKVVRAHSSTFFNDTVRSIASPQEVNNTTFLAVLVVVLALVGTSVYFAKFFLDDTKRTSAETGTAPDDGSEWLEEHQSMLRGGGRAKIGQQ